jgi:HK97 family phage prohead protease
MAKENRKLPDTLECGFTIADESVNRNGWRLIVDGISTEAFEKNPVCVVQHDTWAVPVGKWVALTKEKGVLKGRLQFDRNDEDAVRLYWKYADGYMNAVSLHVRPLAESDHEKDLLPGQRYATVVKSELMEISLVTIPAYGNSVKLCYADGKEYKASLITSKSINMNKENEKTVEQLTAELAAQKTLNAENLIEHHRFRGVVGDGEVEPLKKLAASDYASVSAMLKARTPAATETGKEEVDPGAALADALVKVHVDRGAIAEAEKAVYRAAAIGDYEGTKKALEAKPGTQQAKDFVQNLGGAQASAETDERKKWSFMDWYRKDLQGLQAMLKNDPDAYRQLEAAFATECGAMKLGMQTDEKLS